MRRVAISAVCLAFAACGSNPKGGTPRLSAAAKDCPRLDTPVDVDACRAEMKGPYGYTPEHPLEWGMLASDGMKLWGTRLACRDGSIPTSVKREGSIGPAPIPSESPSPLENPLDILDRWTVQCKGSEPLTVYANIYRCGSTCPPSGLDLAPAPVPGLLKELSAAQKQGDVEATKAVAKRAVQTAPDFEVAWLASALALRELGEMEEVIRYLDGAAEAVSHPWQHRAVAAAEVLDAERYEEAIERADVVMRGAEEGSIPWGLAMCVKASAMLETGGADDEARELGERACAAGIKRCC